MPPPPAAATSITPRFLLGPALRTQSDRRLVALVREGYETAFEEIVRRYGRALDRYAAAIVPRHRAEDVTQDAFSKALLALRGTENEIELRPWLYRIVRNTALNDLRDQPAAAAPLLDTEESPMSVADQIEHREELKDLMRRLGELPDSQRAAIVMRELDGLSHEEIAAALGISGGAARQAIHRARVGLRDGLGMLLPFPLLRWMLSAPGIAGEATTGAGGAIAGAAGGAGGGIAIKAAAATVLVAGSVGGGVAIHEQSGNHDVAAASTISRKAGPAQTGAPLAGAPPAASAGSGGSAARVDGDGSGSGVGLADNSGPGSGDEREIAGTSGDDSSSGPGSVGSGSGSGSGSGHEASDDNSGPGAAGQGGPRPPVAPQPPSGGQGFGYDSGSGHSGSDGSNSSGYSGPGSYDSGHGGGGAGSEDQQTTPAPPPVYPSSGSGSGTPGGQYSGSGHSGSGYSGYGGGSGTSGSGSDGSASDGSPESGRTIPG